MKDISPTTEQKSEALFLLYEAAFDLWNERIERQAREERRATWNDMPQSVKAAIMRDISLTEEPATAAPRS